VQRFGHGPPDPDDVVQAAFEGFARLDDRATILEPVAFPRRAGPVASIQKPSRFRAAHLAPSPIQHEAVQQRKEIGAGFRASGVRSGV
jgi:hypothetical protein